MRHEVLCFIFIGCLWFWFFFFLPTALYSVRERVSHRGLVGFDMEGGKLCGM